jgi:peptide/nickel transport system ATP-binding protein
MVARALLLHPHLIVADEPVSMVDASLRATILGSLRQLNQERGISIIYITHDLATAYQVADNIIVMYRASVAEAGDVELVVKAPKHPYTQLLVASIPQVSTERTWLDEQEGRPRTDVGDGGCKFVARCPVAIPVCRQVAPMPRRTEPDRVVACHHHAGADT